jgi:hypothetical protein
VRLDVSLSDGSRLVGEPTLTSIPFTSDDVGKMNLPLAYLRSLSLDHGMASVRMRNDDKIRGSITGMKELSLKTVVGTLTIPIEMVQEMKVHLAGGQEMDWEVLPFPKDSNWMGGRGQAATVDGGEVVLQGQPVWTKQTYAVPQSFRCDVALDQTVSNDGCLWVVLIPDGADAEAMVPPQNVAIQLGYHQPGGDSGMLTVAAQGMQPMDVGKGPFAFQAGKAYHLEIEVKPDVIRTTLNGEAFESRITVPFKSFRIELMGWQPMNTWRVSKCGGQ